MKTNQTTKQTFTAAPSQGGYSKNPVQLLQNKKPAENPFQSLQQKASDQPGYNPIQLMVQPKNTTAAGTGNQPPVQRFQVNVQTNAASAADDTITAIGFKDRPGHTNIGGDPFGANRHVVSVQLEFKAIQSMFVGKTIGEAARSLRCDPNAAAVQNALKTRLAGFKPQRLLFQGSGSANAQLQNFTDLAESEMNKYRPGKPAFDPEKYQQAVLLAFIGTFDSPPDSVKQHNLDKITGAIALHRYTIQRAYNIPDQYMPGEAEVTQLFLKMSSDDIAQRGAGLAQSLRAGGDAQSASLFGSFPQSSTRQQPRYSLGGGTTHAPQLNTPYGQPQGGQPLLPPISSIFTTIPQTHGYGGQQQSAYSTAPSGYQLHQPVHTYQPPYQYPVPSQPQNPYNPYPPYYGGQ
jgi:hypothetical protein